MPLFDPAAPCSAIADQLGEPHIGTAPEATGWLLLTHAGPWGQQGFTDSGLPDEVVELLTTRCDEAGVRAQLVRRHDRAPVAPTAWFVHAPGHTDGWIRRVSLDAIEDAADLDPAIAADAAPPPGFGSEVTERMVLVCTHAKRDACCSRLGRPLASAMASQRPEAVWETTHVTAHRFAANVVVLPTGASYARVTLADVNRVLADVAEDRLTMDLLRGRCGLTRSAQAAEILLRRTFEAQDRGTVTWLGTDSAAGDTDVHVFRVHDDTYAVAMRKVPVGIERPMTDGDDEFKDPGTWVLDRMTRRF